MSEIENMQNEREQRAEDDAYMAAMEDRMEHERDLVDVGTAPNIDPGVDARIVDAGPVTLQRGLDTLAGEPAPQPGDGDPLREDVTRYTRPHLRTARAEMRQIIGDGYKGPELHAQARRQLQAIEDEMVRRGMDVTAESEPADHSVSAAFGDAFAGAGVDTLVVKQAGNPAVPAPVLVAMVLAELQRMLAEISNHRGSITARAVRQRIGALEEALQAALLPRDRLKTADVVIRTDGERAELSVDGATFPWALHARNINLDMLEAGLMVVMVPLLAHRVQLVDVNGTQAEPRRMPAGDVAGDEQPTDLGAVAREVADRRRARTMRGAEDPA